MNDKPLIVWFRQDLRLADNPALNAAATTGQPLILLYIDNFDKAGDWGPGGASKIWLHQSLTSLAGNLKSQGACLTLRSGNSLEVLEELISETNAAGVYWNRCYEPLSIERDREIKASLSEQRIDVKSFNAALIYEPREMQTKSGTPFKVFTPYWKSMQAKGEPIQALQKPTELVSFPSPTSDNLEDWNLMPTGPDWSAGITNHWQPGEQGARDKLSAFLKNGLKGYADLRDRPDKEHCSALSPHLHFGEISPRQVWHITQHHMTADQYQTLDRDGWSYLREIAWREFSYHLLFHYPHLPAKPWNAKFQNFPWARDDDHLEAW
jgi:deoxyribodipyrimidine photo-lyase